MVKLAYVSLLSDGSSVADGKDGSTPWEKLSDLKESHPIQVAEFAMQMGLALNLLNRWVLPVLKKRDEIISLVK
ncbi:hypothetical protein ACHAXS_000466 [Conticribra weissflogii]